MGGEKENVEETQKSVLNKSLGGGPHGLGDPDDKSLRKVERDILIPKKLREKIKEEKCAVEVSDFFNCSKETGLLNVIKCREQNKIMKNCYAHWFYDKDLVNECTQEYLQERTYYRQNGVPTESVKKTLRFNRGQNAQ